MCRPAAVAASPQVAQRWRFQTTPVGVARQGAEGRGVAEVLPRARVADLGTQLRDNGYQVRGAFRPADPAVTQESLASRGGA